MTVTDNLIDDCNRYPAVNLARFTTLHFQITCLIAVSENMTPTLLSDSPCAAIAAEFEDFQLNAYARNPDGSPKDPDDYSFGGVEDLIKSKLATKEEATRFWEWSRDRGREKRQPLPPPIASQYIHAIAETNLTTNPTTVSSTRWIRRCIHTSH
jgi:hypothetical protein